MAVLVEEDLRLHPLRLRLREVSLVPGAFFYTAVDVDSKGRGLSCVVLIGTLFIAFLLKMLDLVIDPFGDG